MKKKYPTCSRAHKVILKDELAAMMALAVRQRMDTGEKRYYKCPWSNHYHLTSEEKINA